jgi:hypothetical protein
MNYLSSDLKNLRKGKQTSQSRKEEILRLRTGIIEIESREIEKNQLK